jgi:hypothetical protein
VRRLPALALLLVLLPACGSQKHYAENRFRDLTDIVRGHIMAGKVLGAQVEATRFLSLGWTTEDKAWSAGWHKRAFDKWHETISTWGLILGRHEEKLVYGIPRVSGTYGWSFGGGWPTYDSTPTKAFWDWFTLRATVAVLIGIDFELRLGEVIDFAGGLFTWDPSEDDKK